MKKRKKLVFEEREIIEMMLREGHTQRSIAKRKFKPGDAGQLKCEFSAKY